MESLNPKSVTFTITLHFGFATTDDAHGGTEHVLVLSVLMCEPQCYEINERDNIQIIASNCADTLV